MITPVRPLAVRVPGSTSNLGPGYDVLGLAVDRALEAVWAPGDRPLVIEASGSLEGLDPTDDLVHRTLAAALGVEVGQLAGHLRLVSAVPVARGLGSSAAARIAGEILALEWRRGGGGSGDPAEVRGPPGPVAVTGVERRALVERASRGEGHPDNAVPAAVGGLVATSFEDGIVRWTSLPLSPAVGLAFAAPGTEVRTDEARRVLPRSVPHVDAVANAARLAVLLAGLARADGDRIAWGLQDRLHVPWRWPLVPGADAAAAAARAAGAWGVTLSGSGSGLLALSPRDRAEGVAMAMDEAFSRDPSTPEGASGAGVSGADAGTAIGRRWAFALRPALLGGTVETGAVSDGR